MTICILLLIISVAVITFLMSRELLRSYRFRRHLQEGTPVRFYIGEEKMYGRVLQYFPKHKASHVVFSDPELDYDRVISLNIKDIYQP